MPPLVSFVVPSYNYGRYLPDCLGSILGQQGQHDFEVIVIDDASTDDTQAVLGSFRDPRIRALRHPTNRGHAATITRGLEEARGELVARIDPDDRYRPTFLATVVPLLLDHPEVGLVYGDAALIDAGGSTTAERSDRVHGGRDAQGNELVALLQENFICAPTAIARRQAWLGALPIPAGLAFNDWYFTVMMARRYDFYYRHAVLADYRVHPANFHSRIARDRSEEVSVFRLLDGIFGEVEATPALEQRKRRARRRIYGAQYATLADKYFGFGMDADARRCYLRAVWYRPASLRRAGLLRRLAGTVAGRRAYEASKSAARAALSPRRAR